MDANLATLNAQRTGGDAPSDVDAYGLIDSEVATLLVGVSRSDNPAASGPAPTSRTVGSVTGKQTLHIADQRLNVQGEVAFYHAERPNLDSRANQIEPGYFLQMDGRGEGSPFTYGLSFEQYGENFNPKGVQVIPDSTRTEARAGWNFAGGYRVGTRIVRLEENMSKDWWQEAHRAGTTVSAPLFPDLLPGVRGTLDGYVEHRDAQTWQARSFGGTFDLGVSLGRGSTVHAALTRHESRNIGSENATSTHRLDLRLDQVVSLFGLRGKVNPNVFLRRVTGNHALVEERGGGLDFNIRDDNHALNVHYHVLHHDRTQPFLFSDFSDELALRYGYNDGAQTLSFRLGYIGHYLDERPPAFDVGLVYEVAFP